MRSPCSAGVNFRPPTTESPVAYSLVLSPSVTRSNDAARSDVAVLDRDFGAESPTPNRTDAMTRFIPLDAARVSTRAATGRARPGDHAATDELMTLVYDDLRHLSRLRLSVTGGDHVELLAANTPTPLSAVVVSRVVATVEHDPARLKDPRDHVADVLVVRRRWLVLA